MIKNLLRIHPQSYQNLLILKQLHISNANLQTIKQTIWSFKHKLPLQYEKSILEFCDTMSEEFTSLSLLSTAARMFKGLDCEGVLEKKIEEFQYCYENRVELSQDQVSVVGYNLACLYEKNGMDAKAEQILEEVVGFQSLKSLLKVKIYLKSHSTQNPHKYLKQKLEIEFLDRYLKIKNAHQNQQKIKSLNYCYLHQIYNIGLCYKKLKKYSKCLCFFEKVLEFENKQSKIWALAKINQAQSHYFLGSSQNAINILNSLLSQSNCYIQPYLAQINMKISTWTKTNEILELSDNFGTNYRKDALKLLNNQGKIHKNLLKNKKLCILQSKLEELNKIMQVKKDYGLNLGEIGVYKSCKSFLAYTSTPKPPTRNHCKTPLSVLRTNQNSLKPPNFNIDIRKLSNFSNLAKNLSSALNSKLISKTISTSNIAAYSSDRSIASESSTGQNENQINHFWASIKNSHDPAQIAQKYLNLGDVYLKANDLQNAEIVYKKALDKGRYEAYGRLGNIFYVKNKNLAIEYYQKYLNHFNSSDHEIRLKLLHCYSKTPQFHKKAIQNLKKILQSNPYDIQAHILLSTVYMKQNHFDKAIELCEKFKKINFMCYENHHLLGLLYKASGKNRQAFNCFITALRVDPLNTSSLIELTQLTQIDGFYPELIKIYKKALEINRKNHEIIQILKYLIEKTKIQFENIKPKLVFSELIALGDYFLENQMVYEAQYSYREAASYTNNTLLKEKLGNLEYFKNNYEQAEKYFKESQSRKPHLKVHLKLADSLIKQRKFSEAESLLQQYLTKESQNKSVCLNMLGQCEYELGKYERALEKFKLSSHLGYNRRVNFTWEKACRRKIMEQMKKQASLK